MSSGPAEEPAREEEDPVPATEANAVPDAPEAPDPTARLEPASQGSPVATKAVPGEAEETPRTDGEQEVPPPNGTKKPTTHRRKRRKPAHFLTELPVLLVIAFLL